MTDRHIDAYIEDIYTCVRSRCGFCFSGCPAFLAKGFETYTSRGKCLIIKGVLEGKITPSQELAERLSCCTGCGVCMTNCDVDRPAVFRAMREDLWEMGFALRAHKDVCEMIGSNGSPYGTDGRDLHRQLYLGRTQGSKTLFYPGCTATAREQQLARAMARILGNYDMLPLPECCGSVAAKVGDDATAFEQAKKIQKAVRGYDTVVTACAGCYSMMRIAYPKMGIELGPEVLHATQYIFRRLSEGSIRLSSIGTGTVVTYHDPCHLGRHADVYEEPRAILENMGFSVIEMEHARRDALCCGAGGGMRSGHTETAHTIASMRMAQARATGADLVVSACPFCEHNLRETGAGEQEQLPVVDIVELVAQALMQ
jgi:Fe-S oxidoreductase